MMYYQILVTAADKKLLYHVHAETLFRGQRAARDKFLDNCRKRGLPFRNIELSTQVLLNRASEQTEESCYARLQRR